MIYYLTKNELSIELRTPLFTEPSSELNSTKVTINLRICTKMILRLTFQFEIQVCTAASSLVCHFLFKRVSSKCIELSRASRPDRIERRERFVVCIWILLLCLAIELRLKQVGPSYLCLCLYVVHSTTLVLRKSICYVIFSILNNLLLWSSPRIHPYQQAIYTAQRYSA